MNLFMDTKLYNNISEIQETKKDQETAKQELYVLWQECFGDSSAYTDFYFKWKVKDNQILSIYKNDELSSMLHLNPYLVTVQGKKVSSNYIVGVATKKQNRRQGQMKSLLEVALHEMYQEHIPFTYLSPAAEAIYLPFGFRIVYEQERWNQILLETRMKLRAATFNNKSIDGLTVVALGLADKVRIEELVSFSNQQLLQRYDVYIERTPYYYERLLHEITSTGGEVLLCYRSDQLVGYASYMAEDGIYVTECIYSLEEKDAVMEAISEFTEKTVNQGIYEMKNESAPTIMVRIADWNSFVLNISATEEIRIVMEVQDPIIEENNGIYALQFTNQGCKITRTTEKPEVSADIADLSRLFFARMTEKELFGIVKKEEKKNKEEILSKLKRINTYNKVFINDVV